MGVDAEQRLEAGGAGGSKSQGPLPAGSLEPAVREERGGEPSGKGATEVGRRSVQSRQG